MKECGMRDKGELDSVPEETFEGAYKRHGEHEEFEAFLLEYLVGSILRGEPRIGEAAHHTFLDICRHSLEAFKDWPTHKLADNPAAPILLEYLLSAFSRYVKAVEVTRTKLDTADRRALLANAFCFTGSPTSTTTEDQLIETCHAFSSVVFDSLASGITPTPKTFTIAKCAAYKAYYGEDWIKDDDTAKSRMDNVRRILREEGYLPKKKVK
jgi:hypothetical protein